VKCPDVNESKLREGEELGEREMPKFEGNAEFLAIPLANQLEKPCRLPAFITAKRGTERRPNSIFCLYKEIEILPDAHPKH